MNASSVNRVHRFLRGGRLDRLLAWQIRRPGWVLLLVAATLLPMGWAASRLELRTSFSELLPDNKPSVVELRRVKERLAAQSTLTVVAQASGPEILERFVDELTPKIEALGPKLVAGVDSGPRPIEEFLENNQYAYAKLEDLRQLRDAVVDYYDQAVGKAVGFDLGLDDEPSTPASSESKGPQKSRAHARVMSLVDGLDKKAREVRAHSLGRNGYYIGEGGHLAAILVRTPFGTADPRAFELRRTIAKLAQDLGYSAKDPKFQVHFTGNLLTSAEQQQAVVRDLTHVGILGVGLVLGVVFLFFLRFRTLMAMGITIAVGLVWSFGVASFTVGYLNTATGFLVSIIAGNGINFGIIYMGRYIEARRDQKVPPVEALTIARRETWQATLAASGAAMVAYGSLAATDFRGFKHFGLIGGAGMLLCWAATYATLPPLLLLTERVRPMFDHEPAWRQKLKGVYGLPFAWLVKRFPRALAWVGLVIGVVSTGMMVRYFWTDPMEYDMHTVRNDPSSPTSAARLSLRVDKIVGRQGQDGRAIVVDRLDQVAPLTRELERRLRAAPPGHKPFDKVVSILDFIPQHQAEKRRLVAEIEDRVRRARAHGVLSDADYRRIAPHLPKQMKPVTVESLPADIARPFTEKNGRRGTIVYIVPRTGRSVYDAHYLREFADAFREVRLPNGEIIRGTGDPVIFTDMLLNVSEDAPKAIALSLFGTILVVLAAFRWRRSGWMALLSMLLGVAWMVAVLSMLGAKLNFLNFVALPITIGVGADYALNVMKRRELMPKDDLPRLLIETGGAVVLCSLTTMLGYLALMSSINGAVRSFGLAAAIGEVTTLLAAVLFLPGWLGARRARTQPRSVEP